MTSVVINSNYLCYKWNQYTPKTVKKITIDNPKYDDIFVGLCINIENLYHAYKYRFVSLIEKICHLHLKFNLANEMVLAFSLHYKLTKYHEYMMRNHALYSDSKLHNSNNFAILKEISMMKTIITDFRTNVLNAFVLLDVYVSRIDKEKT